MTEILGTPTRLSLRVGRVLSDKDYGSFRVEAEIEVTLMDGEDADKSFQSMVAWLKANVGHDIKAQKAAYDQLQPAPDLPHDDEGNFVADTSYGIGDHRAVPPQGALKADGPTNFPEHDAQAPVTAPQATVAGSGSSNEVHYVRDATISHQQTDTGIDYLLVKGGKWKMYGVKMWPEAVDEFISLAWREWPIGKGYGLPDGYNEVAIRLKEDGKPDRVVGLR